MEGYFKYELTEFEIEEVNTFCNSVDYCAIEQLLGWSQLFYKNRICYFYLTENNKIISFCQINEKFRSAQITFGPVCQEKETMIVSINEIIKYYKNKKYFYLEVQLYNKTGYDNDYIEYSLNKLHNINYLFDNKNTKSSIEIDLKSDIVDIFRSMRKGHKSDINKAIKLGISVSKTNRENEINEFISIYNKMYESRHITGILSLDNIHAILNYILKKNKGLLLVAKDSDNTVLGGAILVTQGISVRYLIGAADPDKRDKPILHLVLYEGIKQAKINNFKYFDFWGYDHFVERNSQMFFINQFKKGFGGYFTFFSKKMNIDLIPFGTNTYRFLQMIRKTIKRLNNLLYQGS